ncbi:MAG: beta strand repeat-containing protein, partial [Cyanobacteriota bacterium]
VIDNGLPPAVASSGLTSPNIAAAYGIGSVITIRVPFTEIVTVTGAPTLLLETGSTDRIATYSSGSGTDTLTFTYVVQAGDSSADLDAVSTTSLQLNGGTIKDGAGNDASLTLPAPGASGSLGANAALVIDGVAPVVTAAGLTSTNANGTYSPGSTITIRVPFTETVIVTGTPRLLLETGAIDRYATYTGGSGSTTLTFTYTVQTGDTSPDLDYTSSTALDLNGGTIRDAFGNNAILTLASPGTAGSLGANAALVIDNGLPPAVASSGLTSPNIAAAYGIGSVITIRVPFTEIVTVTGAPTLLLETGSTDRIATYSSGSGTDTLTFTYTVQAGDDSADLDIASTTALQLNGGTIRDSIGNNAILTLPTPGAVGSLAANTDLVIDGFVPTLSATTPADDASGVSESANLTLTFSEAVQSGSGLIELRRANGVLIESFNVATGAGSSGGSVAFSGSTLTLNPNANFAASTAYYLTIPSTAVTDLAGNGFAGFTEATTLNFSTGDTIAPTVSSVTSVKANGTYGAGTLITLAVRFSEAVSVDHSGGTPTLLLETGSTDRAATYISGSGTDTLTFQYLVQEGDVSADLDFTSTTALQLNGSTIRDTSGNNATLTLPSPGAAGSLGANADLVINTAAPNPPNLGLTTSTPNPTEGSNLSAFIFSTTLAPNDRVYWSFSGPGITGSDFIPASLTGSITLGADRGASFSIAIASDGVTEGEETATLTFYSDPNRTVALVQSQFTLRDITSAGLAGATDGRDQLIGTSGADIISGVPMGSLLNGKGSYDTLSGDGGDDLFMLGTAASVYYNDGKANNAGAGDLAAITDFSAGDRIQLKGAPSDYRLSSGSLAGNSGTLLHWRAAAGAGTTDETIGFIRSLTPAYFSLANTSQFLYVNSL